MKRSALLTPEAPEKKFLITMLLTGNETADFFFSNKEQAKGCYYQLGATMNIAGQAIKKIELIEL